MSDPQGTGHGGSEMRCPYCESDNVSCEDTRSHHFHVCHDCGSRDDFKVTKR